MTADHFDIVVIGAGASGLGFANWYRELHPAAKLIVLEASGEPGGYCKTIARDGFVWDYSGHFFHFKDPSIEQWLRDRMPGQPIKTVVKRGLVRYAERARDGDPTDDTQIETLQAHPAVR